MSWIYQLANLIGLSGDEKVPLIAKKAILKIGVLESHTSELERRLAEAEKWRVVREALDESNLRPLEAIVVKQHLRFTEAESRLRAASELPAKWRGEYKEGQYNILKNSCECANELEAALRGEAEAK